MATLEPYTVPFTIIIDSAEGQPFTFDGLKADADKQYRPLAIPRRFASLGRHPHSLGDYSIEGLTQHVAVERKSKEDIWGTVMGWETKQEAENNKVGRRDRFKCELENLAKIDAAAVIIEATMGECIADVPEWGDRPADHNRKIFFRTVIGMQQDYGIPFIWCDSRRLAEITTYRFLARFHKKWGEGHRTWKSQLLKACGLGF